MYQFSYTDVLSDSSASARELEGKALDHSIELLRKAAEVGPNTKEATEAIYFLQRLWTVLLEDLSNPENGLPDELRAQVISVGIWILREAEKIRQGEVASFDGLIEVSVAIREGLE
ncbi:Flagellar FlaF [Candidatus Filomicrobium marinum]|uniref:Flagellar FlaF n=2 Tax=Filomicrobium TaxID=119044 RepID=A0A0D6JJM1_9HYPH|nr:MULTISPECIES: flagellar biosynthesis regulator FlaF [Filomicrobium]MCV0371589.1 flagellar biosynthesis regulator FlaF [Filomicrobium sp.]CFX54855.1 Flagellar FlaF [Candidatus Filomicrobium marinum]CPR22163.1 Flagellar FlaF [Candidatus Filomicrobium marinum]SDO94499.1 flagellar protein FlaF [Filomicrobium insigne]